MNAGTFVFSWFAVGTIAALLFLFLERIFNSKESREEYQHVTVFVSIAVFFIGPLGLLWILGTLIGIGVQYLVDKFFGMDDNHLNTGGQGV